MQYVEIYRHIHRLMDSQLSLPRELKEMIVGLQGELK